MVHFLVRRLQRLEHCCFFVGRRCINWGFSLHLFHQLVGEGHIFRLVGPSVDESDSISAVLRLPVDVELVEELSLLLPVENLLILPRKELSKSHT